MPLFQISFISVDKEEKTEIYFAKSTHLARRIAKTVMEIMKEKEFDMRWSFCVYKLDRRGYDLEINKDKINHKANNINSIIDENLRCQIVNLLSKIFK